MVPDRSVMDDREKWSQKSTAACGYNKRVVDLLCCWFRWCCFHRILAAMTLSSATSRYVMYRRVNCAMWHNFTFCRGQAVGQQYRSRSCPFLISAGIVFVMEVSVASMCGLVIKLSHLSFYRDDTIPVDISAHIWHRIMWQKSQHCSRHQDTGNYSVWAASKFKKLITVRQMVRVGAFFFCFAQQQTNVIYSMLLFGFLTARL